MSSVTNGNAATNGEKSSDNGLSTLSVNGNQDLSDHTPTKEIAKLSLSSQAVHADDFLNLGQDVAPAMHVSTTFRYSENPDKLKPLSHMTVRIPKAISNSTF